MLKISHKLKKSYLENTRGSCKHSYLHTKAECCGNFLVSPRTQPQTVDKEGRRQGQAALHMILHLTDHAGCEKKKEQHLGICLKLLTWHLSHPTLFSDFGTSCPSCLLRTRFPQYPSGKFASSHRAEPPSQDVELEPMQCPATAPICKAESLGEANGTNSQQLASSASEEVGASLQNKPSPSPFPHGL